VAVELIAGEKVKGESKKAVLACNDYLRMGPGRSLRLLVAEYDKDARNSTPTQSLGTLGKWSAEYAWQTRADLYDAGLEAEKQATEKERQRQIAERRKAIMEEGAAFDFERVALLKRHAEFLEQQIFYQPQPKVDEETARRLGIEALLGWADETTDPEQLDEIARRIVAKLDPDDPKAKYPHVWAQDVKGLAGGKTVEVVRFNAALLSELRATLADIAAETGGRRQRVVNENIDYSKLTDEQLQRVAAGEDPVQVILSDYSGNQS
jgi:hypothetical protein